MSQRWWMENDIHSFWVGSQVLVSTILALPNMITNNVTRTEPALLLVEIKKLNFNIKDLPYAENITLTNFSLN